MFKLLCRLKWAGLLPFARLVESTREDLELHPRHEVIETERKMTLDRALLTSLVDRWRPETHTFQFRWGEMTPTLQDVSYLLGLPLAGHPIGPLIRLQRIYNFLCSMLVFTPFDYCFVTLRGTFIHFPELTY
jgi:hypothetical protein